MSWGEVLWCILSYASSMAPGMTVDWNISVTVGLIQITVYTRLWSPNGEAYWLRWSLDFSSCAAMSLRCFVFCEKFQQISSRFSSSFNLSNNLVYNTIPAKLMTLQSKRSVRGLKPAAAHQLVRTEEAYWVRGETSSRIWNESSCPRCSISSELGRSVWMLLLTVV